VNVVVSEKRRAGEQHREAMHSSAIPYRTSEARRDSILNRRYFPSISTCERSLLERKLVSGQRAAITHLLLPCRMDSILNRAVVRVVVKIEGEFID
jgi:hypothetical protein